MALDFTAFEKAIQDAVVLASGGTLADGKVIWARQDGTRPAAPYATLDLVSFRVVGQDAQRHDYDAEGEPGAEIVLAHGGMREFSLAVTVFYGTLGSAGAVALADVIRTGLVKVAVREVLDAANVSIFDFGQVTNLAQVVNTVYEGRAVLELRGYTTQELEERIGYIASAEITGTIATVTTVETVDIGSPPPSGVWGSGNVWGG